MKVQERSTRYAKLAVQFYESSNRRTSGWLAVFVCTWLGFSRNRAAQAAASISIFSIFSVFPLLVFTLAALRPFVDLPIVLTTAIFTWYLHSDWSSYHLLYGSLGAIIGLLFWVHLSNMIVLFGTHLTAAIQKRSKSEFLALFVEPLMIYAT